LIDVTAIFLFLFLEGKRHGLKLTFFERSDREKKKKKCVEWARNHLAHRNRLIRVGSIKQVRENVIQGLEEEEEERPSRN